MSETLEEMQLRHVREMQAKVSELIVLATVDPVAASRLSPEGAAGMIVATVAARTGISVALIRSDDRSGEVCNARRECFSLCRAAGMSLCAIAAFFERDHTTVRTGIKTYQKRLARGAAQMGAVQ